MRRNRARNRQPTMANCKDECELLMSAVLPLAEQMLTEHRALQPFGCTLSAADQIAQVGGWKSEGVADTASTIAEFEDAFRDGARRGELKATALLHLVSEPAPGSSSPQQAVAVHLDHRDDYSIVVTFPYHFAEGGELVIEEPYAAEGAHKIFEG